MSDYHRDRYTTYFEGKKARKEAENSLNFRDEFETSCSKYTSED